MSGRRGTMTTTTSTTVSAKSETSDSKTNFRVPIPNPPPLFSGPEGLRECRVTNQQSHFFVGDKPFSPETTSQLAYLTRAAQSTPFPLAKNGRIGEIGGVVDRFKIYKGI